jgi:hypothetical protein
MAAPTLVARRLHGPARWSAGSVLPFQLWFPLGVYGASRLIAAAFMAAASSAHKSGYSNLATAWDGGWYRLIASQGYPSSLPISPDGQVEQNAWAFSPVYPLTVRALMATTHLSYSVVAPTLSLVLGAAAMVVIFRLMQRAVSHFSACATVVLSCTFMAAPVMQLAYTESLALLLLASALFLLRERKYVAVAALLLLLALTRPVVVAFIPVVIAHGVGRWHDRATDPFPRKDLKVVLALISWCVVATALWPVIVGLLTRDPFAWTKTHEAWRVEPHFAPGLGWPASFLHNFGWPALVALAFVVLLTVGIVARPGAKAWGPELRAWSVSYPGYLLFATVPGPSVIRWLLLAFPLIWPFPEPAATRSERKFRVILIAMLAMVGLVLQRVWIFDFLAAAAPSVSYP